MLPVEIDAYRTCEFATLAPDGTPVAWPTSGISCADGTFLLTTSVGYPRKALNIRRDGRVALLFSDPTASGLDNPAQILVRGTAVVSDEIHTVPTGDLAAFWRRIFARQPGSRRYLDWPARALADFYFMRLLIRVTPSSVSDRALPEPAFPQLVPGLVGSPVIAGYATAVLTALGATGEPVLLRTTVTASPDGYRVVVPDDLPVHAGPASLLVHRHDAKLDGLHNAVVRGTLVADGAGWVLTPSRVIEPGARHRPGPTDTLRTLRALRATTKRYLAKRGITRPEIPWQDYRALSKQ